MKEKKSWRIIFTVPKKKNEQNFWLELEKYITNSNVNILEMRFFLFILDLVAKQE